MSATGLEVFDRTIQTTNTWLGEIERDIGADRRIAWKVLSTVLHKLRDRLPIHLAAHLGAQLPLLVRGVYYDQYQPAHRPSTCNTVHQFTAEVAEWLSDIRPIDAAAATTTVFALLSRHVTNGQIAKVQDALPKSLREQWLEAETAMLALEP